jgi:aspartokinase
MALERGVPVRVRSTFNPTDEGTLVSNKCSKNREFTGVAFNNDLNCIEFNLEKLELGPDRNLRSLQQARTQTKLRLLKLLSNAGISASIVSPCRPNPFKILLTVKKADTVTALATLHKATVSNREITVNTNLATIGLVSTKITTRHEVEALALMAANKIPVAALSMDQHLLTLLVPQAMADKGLKIIHSQFAGIFAAA